jgi:hypothetical protein
MKIYFKKNNNNKFILFIVILFSTFNLNNQEENYEKINIKYPSAYLLLNNKYVVVGEKGIYFYNREFSTLYSQTNYTDFSLFEGEHETVSMAQFPEKDGGYIIIMVKNIFYIFDDEGAYLKQFDFKNITNKRHHCLIPYGKEDNILNYFIIYIDSGKISIKHFEFNLNDYSNEIKNSKIIPEINDEGYTILLEENLINCIFMKPLDSLNIDHDLITCFYIRSYSPYIKTVSFDPKDNFTEISSTIFNASSSLITYAPIFINGVTNNDKKKAIVYVIFTFYLFSMTFDFTNGFSTLVLENNNDYLVQNSFFNTKMLYFEEKNEFIIASAIHGGCKLLIIKYDNDYMMIEKGYIDYIDVPCYFTKCFSIIYNGNDYIALNDGGSS